MNSYQKFSSNNRSIRQPNYYLLFPKLSLLYSYLSLVFSSWVYTMSCNIWTIFFFCTLQFWVGVQCASTDNRFNTLGQGSPKLLFAIVTAHLWRPRHFFSTTAYEVGAWQVPCWKLPQVPRGVPKLANLMEEIDWPGAQWMRTLGRWNSSVLP